MNDFSGKVILLDMDGTLCSGEAWTPEECLSAVPIKKGIDLAVEIYRIARFIIIYTARKDELIPATLEWLRRNNIRYHAISNIKTPGDLLIDDKCINVKELI